MEKYRIEYLLDGEIVGTHEFREFNDISAKRTCHSLKLMKNHNLVRCIKESTGAEIDLTLRVSDELDLFIELNGGNARDALNVALARLNLAEKRNNLFHSLNKPEIEPLGHDLHWYKWLFEAKNRGLEEPDLSCAVKDISSKLNELIKRANEL